MRVSRQSFWLLALMFFAAAPPVSSATVPHWFPAPPPLPVYVQPPCPEQGDMWTPGYWARDDQAGFFWVAGMWAPAPQPGYYWTPPYWEWDEGNYTFHQGYWGQHVGYYGGINYGFGYMGVGFSGGEWRDGTFFYNTAVANVNTSKVHSTYVNEVIVHNTTIANADRTSYSGGPGGVNHLPYLSERIYGNEKHLPPTETQLAWARYYSTQKMQRFSENQGKPAVLSLTVPSRQIEAKLDPSDPLDRPPIRALTPDVPNKKAATNPSVVIPHNYALLFATDDYAHWPRLINPIPDADALAETLRSVYRFDVEEVRNPSNEQILQKLTEYLHRRFEPQDQLLIFFSGHGYFDSDLGQGFLVPANAPRVEDDTGHTRLLAHDQIMRYVNRIPSQHVVLIIDACFAGTLDRKVADSGLKGDASQDIYAHATLPELLQRKEGKRTRRYFASGGKDFVPDGVPGHHSPFLSALLVTLNQAADRKGYATLEDIQVGLNSVIPEPRWGDIQDQNEPGADFILLTPTAIRQLSPSM